MKTRRIFILGTMASSPYASMAYMDMQITADPHRLRHNVYYFFEVTSNWSYDPVGQLLMVSRTGREVS